MKNRNQWINLSDIYIYNISGEKTAPLSKKYFDMMSSTVLLQLDFYLQKLIWIYVYIYIYIYVCICIYIYIFIYIYIYIQNKKMK